MELPICVVASLTAQETLFSSEPWLGMYVLHEMLSNREMLSNGELYC